MAKGWLQAVSWNFFFEGSPVVLVEIDALGCVTINFSPTDETF